MPNLLLKKQYKALGLLCCLLFTNIFMCLSAIAEEASAEEWHYTLRPGDSVSDISQNLLSYQYTWNDVVKHNGVSAVANLAPGSIIKIPMHWLKHQPKPALVKQLEGSAQIKKASASHYDQLKLTLR